MGRMRSVIFLLGIALLATGAGGYWAYTQNYRPKAVPQEVLSATTVAPSTTSSTTTSVAPVPVTTPETKTTTSTTSSSTTSTTSSTVPSPVYGKPTHLNIEQIGVDDPLMPIDLNEKDEFEAEPFTIAWYQHSVRPGEPGAMLIGAHVAWRSRGPDRFARLTELRPGDTFALENELGETFEYVVTDIYQVDKEEEFSEFINDVVWLEEPEEHVAWLNTCGGELRPTGSFADNIFVRALLTPEEGS